MTYTFSASESQAQTEHDPKPVRILPNGLNDLFLQEKNCNSDMKKRGGNPEPPELPLPLFGGILRKNDEVFSPLPITGHLLFHYNRYKMKK